MCGRYTFTSPEEAARQVFGYTGPPPYNFENRFAQVAPESRGSLITLGSPEFVLPERKALPQFALRHRIPSMFVNRAFVDEGGLVSFGPNEPRLLARAANFVDRIAKGDMPGDLPVEFPTQFEFVVNLKTAKALGIAVSQSVLLRADHFIE